MAPPEGISTLPRGSVIEPQLDCGVTKGRVKGPPGRRLPRSKKSIDTLLDEDQSESSVVFRDDRGRATSLSALEHSKDSVDLRPEPRLARKGQTPSELATTNSNPNIFKFDFERAWFLKLPSEAGEKTTSDYSSLHEDLSGDGSSDRHSSLSRGSPTHPKEESQISNRRKESSNRNSRPISIGTRSTCSIL